jgi:dihydrofolate synthase/folylpolyglutamate synthase
MGVFSEKTSPRLTRIEALQWLEKRSNFEQLPADHDHKTAFTLTRMRALLRAIGNPERHFPSAHLAGTKGKGSTAAMLAAIVQATELAATSRLTSTELKSEFLWLANRYPPQT